MQRDMSCIMIIMRTFLILRCVMLLQWYPPTWCLGSFHPHVHTMATHWLNHVRTTLISNAIHSLKQGNYSLRRPPKLIIQKIFTKQRWATVYRFMCNRICKSKCLVFQRHFDILFHNLSKINLDVFIRLFHLHWTFKCNWKSLNVDKKTDDDSVTLTQWTLIRAERRSTPQGTGWCAIEHAVAAWTSPLKGSDLHDASSVTQRADGLTPLEFWEGPGHPEHDGGLLGQQQHAQGPRRPHHQVHQGWLLSSQVFKLTRCTRCTSEATKKRE